MEHSIQKILDATTSKRNGPPCLVMKVIDSSGKELASVASGFKSLGGEKEVREGRGACVELMDGGKVKNR